MKEFLARLKQRIKWQRQVLTAPKVPTVSIQLRYPDGRIAIASYEWENDEEGRELALQGYAKFSRMPIEELRKRVAPDAPSYRIEV